MHKKHKKFTKVFLFAILIILAFILLFVKLENTNTNNINKILFELSYLNFNDLIHRLPCNLRSNIEYQTNAKLREQLNELMIEKFKHCSNLEYYSLNPLETCYVGNIYHYVDIKILLNRFSYSERKKISFIVNNTYKNNKNIFVKDTIAVRDNRLWKTLTMMNWLNLLNESEKEFWIRQYSQMKVNVSQPIFPQTYNRVRVLSGLGINNVKDLESYNITDTNICAYKPTIFDAFNQDIFKEEKRTMTSKYARIRLLCLQKLNSSEKREIRIPSRISSCESDSEEISDQFKNF